MDICSFFARRSDWGNELIALFRNRSNIEGGIGRIAEGGTNLCNAEVQSFIEIDMSFRSPHDLFEFSSRDNLTGAPKEQREHLRRLCLQAHIDARPVKPSGG